MSSSHSNESSELTRKESTLQQCSSQKAFEFYSSKYDNMLIFLDSILKDMANPEEGLHSWLAKLKTINFDIFLSILVKQLANNSVDEVIQNFADEEGFSLDNIKADDLHRLNNTLICFKP